MSIEEKRLIPIEYSGGRGVTGCSAYRNVGHTGEMKVSASVWTRAFLITDSTFCQINSNISFRPVFSFSFSYHITSSYSY